MDKSDWRNCTYWTVRYRDSPDWSSPVRAAPDVMTVIYNPDESVADLNRGAANLKKTIISLSLFSGIFRYF